MPSLFVEWYFCDWTLIYSIDRKELVMSFNRLRDKLLGYRFLVFCGALLTGTLALYAQDITPVQNVTCEVASLAQLAPLNQTDASLVAKALPRAVSFIVEADTQTLTGRLVCADIRPAFYNCGHTKQSVWFCKPDCFLGRDGSQYVLQTSIKSYSLIGDQNEIRPLLKDRVIVTGELKGDTIRVLSIIKTRKKDNPERGMVGTSAPK